MKSTGYTANEFSISRFEVVSTPSELLAEPAYHVGQAVVYITTNGRYLIAEPALSPMAEKIWCGLMENLYYSYSDSDRVDAIQSIKEHLEDEAKQTAVIDIYNKEKESIEYYLIRDIVGYRELDVLFCDPHVEDIICTRYDREAAVIHRNHQDMEMLKTNVRFPTQDAFDRTLQIIAQKEGRAPTTSKPIVYCSTKNNDRITITWKSEISLPGSTLAVRKFPRDPYTITHLLKDNVLSPLMAAYIWMMNDARSFSFVVGGTGSGKTTAINALVCMSNPRWHILTIEEVRELVIPHFWNEYLITRQNPQISGSEYDVDILGLGMASLRKKPHYVIVGEVRGREIQQLFQIALTGHGCVSSVHASSAQELFTRLGGDQMGVSHTQQSSIHYLVCIQKVKVAINNNNNNHGTLRRKIVSITEVVAEPTGPVLYELFRYDPKHDKFVIGDIAQLIQNSKHLKNAVKFLGVDNIFYDIQRRIDLLSRCVESKAYKINDVFSIISEYYDVADPLSV